MRGRTAHHRIKTHEEVMTTPAQLSALMSEAQERLKLNSTTDPAMEGVWSLPLDPVHPIRVRVDSERAQLVFRRSIGIPPAGDQTSLQEICLVFNNNWKQTAGLGIGLESPGGTITQFQNLAISPLSTETLTEALAAFESRALALAALVHQRPETPAQATSDSALSMLGMRV
jgi:hypothetical protein